MRNPGWLLALAAWVAAGGAGCVSDKEPVARGPGIHFDLQAFIDRELAAGKTTVVVPPGRYRVEPRHGRHLFFKDLHDVEILADGVEMVCTETSEALGFEQCRHVRMRGLAIDYDPLPFTEGRITALAPDKSWVEFEILDGYPDRRLEERIEIYDPASGELRRETTGWQAPFEAAGPHRYRIAKHAGYRFRAERDTEQVGDILVTNHASAPGGGSGHAVESARCAGLRLEDIRLFAAGCFGFLEHDCEGSTYLRCRIDRRPPETDYPKRAWPRMRSLNADAFHSVGAVRGPSLIGCTARFQGDDCVNIHGQYDMVLAATGKELRVMAARGALSLEPGDPAEFLPYEGARPPDAVAVKIEPAAPETETEIAFAARQRMDEGLHRHFSDGKARVFTLTLDRAVALPAGSLVCSGRRVGNGFVVKDCDFGFNRSRGILIKASRGEVSGNRITGAWMSAVLVTPEFWWCEAGSSSDVTIRDNVIRRCRGIAIRVEAEGGSGKPLPDGAHRNIAILHNTVEDSPWPNIRVTSTEGLMIEGNRLAPVPCGGSGKTAVVMEQCAGIKGNDAVASPSAGKP